jgi:hypothetical protein
MNIPRQNLFTGPLLLAYGLCIIALVFSIFTSRNRSEPCETILETGKQLCGPFLDYWNNHGEVDLQGFPISNRFQETSPTDGQTYTVQYFEKAIFELRPDGAGGTHITLAPIGAIMYRALYPDGPPPTPWDEALDALPTPATTHNLQEPFLTFWQKNGGEEQFGPPVSKPFSEQIDGKPYKVQYFERAKLELHPEIGQSRYQVLPATLGRTLFTQRYPQGEPTPLPTP